MGSNLNTHEMNLEILTSDQQEKYADMVDAVAQVAFLQSIDAVVDIGKDIFDEKGKIQMDDNTAKAIGLSINEIALDDIIEMTQNISREDLVKFLVVALGHQAFSMMNSNPAFMMKVSMRALVNKRFKKK